MMNTLKKILGLLWIIIGPVGVFYLIKTASAEISKNPAIDTKVQWGIFIAVFIPIAIGFVIFGWFALKGEYNEHAS